MVYTVHQTLVLAPCASLRGTHVATYIHVPPTHPAESYRPNYLYSLLNFIGYWTLKYIIIIIIIIIITTDINDMNCYSIVYINFKEPNQYIFAI